jgi:hypothetical protein
MHNREWQRAEAVSASIATQMSFELTAYLNPAKGE